MTEDSDTVETLVGTTVVETPKQVYNPVTEEYERIADLSESGYKRRFLAVLNELKSGETIDVGKAPVLTFDKERWKLGHDGDHFILEKRELEGKLGEFLDGGTA